MADSAFGRTVCIGNFGHHWQVAGTLDHPPLLLVIVQGQTAALQRFQLHLAGFFGAVRAQLRVVGTASQYSHAGCGQDSEEEAGLGSHRAAPGCRGFARFESMEPG